MHFEKEEAEVKRYKLDYQIPYVFDAGPLGDGKEVLWGTQTLKFEADDDDAARDEVRSSFESKTVDLVIDGRTETWRYSINRLEEVARPITLPDLPMNGQKVR